jgi:hypothetical protein
MSDGSFPTLFHHVVEMRFISGIFLRSPCGYSAIAQKSWSHDKGRKKAAVSRALPAFHKELGMSFGEWRRRLRCC